VSAPHPVHDVEHALGMLERLPGGPELLRAARRREDVALVGGAVRDLLLEHWPREIDVTVASDAAALAHELATSISPSERAYGRVVEPVIHGRFGTASVAWGYGRIDIAELRAESYPTPGALPEVRPATVQEDLARRDFTVNAMSIPLVGPERGRLLAVAGASDDLRDGLLRVLHERSFIDDPTRLLRLARYAARLGFAIEPRTLELAREAVDAAALTSVSGERIGAELRLATREDTAAQAFAILEELGALAALGMPSPFDAELAASSLALLPRDGHRDEVVLAVALHPREPLPDRASSVRATLDELGFDAETRGRVLSAAVHSHALAAELAKSDLSRASQLRRLLAAAPIEAVAVAGAEAARTSPEAAAKARRWIQELRHVKLQIDGRALLAAGVPEGPEVGLRLEHALACKLDGEIAATADAELAAALGAAC
jgi:tRNA nucleotidyltransferase (CCA-adding enzyme)